MQRKGMFNITSIYFTRFARKFLFFFGYIIILLKDKAVLIPA